MYIIRNSIIHSYIGDHQYCLYMLWYMFNKGFSLHNETSNELPKPRDGIPTRRGGSSPPGCRPTENMAPCHGLGTSEVHGLQNFNFISISLISLISLL